MELGPPPDSEPIMWKRRAGGAATILPEERSKEGLIAAAEHAFARQRIDRARLLAERAAALEGDVADHPRLLLLQARIARQDGHTQDVSRLSTTLAGLAKSDVRAAFALAEFASDAHLKVAALGWLENALALDPQHEPSLLMATRLLRQLDKQDRAYQLLEQARSADPNLVPVNLTLAEMLQEDGRFGEAAEVYRAVLGLHPTHPAALSGLLNTRHADKDEALLKRAELAADAIESPLPQRISLHYSLAKAFDRGGGYGEAFGHAAAANDLLRRGHPHDAAAEHRRSERLVSNLRLFANVELSQDDPSPVVPVFIIGMPRSGTTLVEQMLSGHSTVSGLGELSFWPALAARWNLNGEEFALPDVERAHTAAQRYRDLLQSRGASTGFAIDKLPDNYRFVPLIAALLPDAKFIHCIRDPRDNLVSIFFEHFAPHQTYTTGIDSIVARRHDHDRVTSEWNALYGDRLTRLDYETLVSEGEPAMRSLTGQLGLPWEDALMDYRSQARSVRTPSRQQVREPLYDRSVGRWEHYQPWMGAAFDALTQ